MTHAEQEFGEGNGNQTSGDAEHGVDGELPGIDELIGGNFEERAVAKEEAKDHPGSDGSEDHGTENRGVEVSDDFFEGEENRGHGSVEGGGDGGGSADGDEGFYFFGAQAERASEDGSDAGADLDGRAFAAEGDAAGESDGGAKELSEDGAEGDAALAGEESGFGLRNAASARVREIFVQEITDAEGSGDGQYEATPRGAAGRIESHADAFSEENESDDGEAGEGPDDEGQGEEDLVFTGLQFGLGES